MRTHPKKSSLELLVIALYEKGFLQGNGNDIDNLLEEHKILHKNEIMDARSNGRWSCTEKYGEIRTNKQYYDENFSN